MTLKGHYALFQNMCAIVLLVIYFSFTFNLLLVINN